MRVAIVGGGAAGLMGALMLARRGHDVLVVDQDNVEPAPDVEAAAVEAYRPSAPQVVQPHVVMSRCRLVLAERLPDVLSMLVDAGGLEVPLAKRIPPSLVGFEAALGDEQYTTVMTRRSTLDWVLRRAVSGEKNVELRRARVMGLSGRPGHLPHVTGVRTDDGDVAVDVVIDASGRRSPVDRWLAELGARPPVKSSAECGVTYVSRHYRFKPDAELPGPATTRVVMPYEQFTAVLFCSDNRAVQTAFVPLTEDRRFRGLIRPEVYDAVLSTLPTHARWMPALEPISAIRQMVAPHNTLRRLVADGMPIATGLLPIGDAVCTTNPTFGRGLSLAAWTAADLVDVLEEYGDDPLQAALALDERIVQHVVPYYHDQAQVDSARLAMLRHAVTGVPTPNLPNVPGTLSFPQLQAASLVDPVAYRAFWAVMGMLRPPHEVYSDPDLATTVGDVLAEGPARQQPAPDIDSVMAALTT